MLDGGIYACVAASASSSVLSPMDVVPWVCRDVLADMPRELSRIDPVGVDAAGASYYFFAPFLSDFRIYKSTSVPKSFSVCCDSVEDVSALVAQLTAAGDSKELLSALTACHPPCCTRVVS